MNRRTYLATTGSALAAIAVVPAGVAAVGEVTVEPADLTIGDDSQGLTLIVRLGDDPDRVTVHVDVTPLSADAAVDLSDLAIHPEARKFDGATLTDARVETGPRTTAVLSLDLDEGADALRGKIVLDGLDTDEAVHTPELRYPVSLTAPDEEPTFDAESELFLVEDPTQREPELHVRSHRLALGDRSQPIGVPVSNLPPDAEEVVIDANVSELATVAGIDIGDLTLEETTLQDE